MLAESADETVSSFSCRALSAERRRAGSDGVGVDGMGGGLSAFSDLGVWG